MDYKELVTADGRDGTPLGRKDKGLSMATELATGFGEATVTKDGEVVYSETEVERTGGRYLTVGEVEAMAAADPGHDWGIHMIGAMSENHFKRSPDGRWLEISLGRGFA